jgi:hypothetical protein
MQWCVAKASQRCQEGWPQDPTTLPGHEKWTYGGARGVFAESPNRVSLLGGGELPNLKRPPSRLLTDIGPNVLFRMAGLPWRNANIATPPGNGGSRQDPAKGMEACRGAVPPYREMGVDARWEHCIIGSTPRARSSRSGPSGTTSSNARTPSTSVRMMRRSASGWSTTTSFRLLRCIIFSGRELPTDQSRRKSSNRFGAIAVHSIETRGAFALRFVRFLRFMQLKRCDKLLQLTLGKPTNCGRVRWKAEYSSISFSSP